MSGNLCERSNHGAEDASLNTDLQSFDAAINLEEGQPSLETPTAHTAIVLNCQDYCLEYSPKNSHFWTPTYNRCTSSAGRPS